MIVVVKLTGVKRNLAMPVDVITSPEEYTRPFQLFLAGGITNCPDWQSEAISLIKGNLISSCREVILINPRRVEWNIGDKDAAAKQIEWEHGALESSDGYLFWFPKETLCPITLYELGKVAAGTKKPLFVGTDVDYARRFDVITQLSLISRITENSVQCTLERVVYCFTQYIKTGKIPVWR
jgi:hypothetical protein